MERKKQCRVFDKPYSKKKGVVKGVYNQTADVMSVRFDEEDTMAAVACADGFVKVYNLNTSNKLMELNTNTETINISATTVRWRPGSQQLKGTQSSSSTLLAANANGSLFQFLAKSGKIVWQIQEEDNYIFAMDYNHQGTQFATTGKDCAIRIYDEETKKVAIKLQGVSWHKPGHNNRLFGLRINPEDSNILLSGGWDQNVHIWDIRAGNVIGTICGPKICGDAIDIKGSMILTGAHRNNEQLQLWDFGTQKLMHSYAWDDTHTSSSGFIFACQFNKTNGDYILGAGANAVRLYSTKEDFRELLEIRTNPEATVYTVDSGNFSSKVLLGCKGGQTYLVNINSQNE